MSTDAASLISTWNQNADAAAEAPLVEPNPVLSLVTICVVIAFIPLYMLALFIVYLAKKARRKLRKIRSSPETTPSLIDPTEGSGHVPSTARLFTTSSMRSDMPMITAPPSDRRLTSDLSPCCSNVPCDKEGVFTHYSSENKDIIRLCLESKTPYRHVKFAFQFNDQQIHSLYEQQTDLKFETKPPTDPDVNIEEEKSYTADKAVGNDPPAEPDEPYDEGYMEQLRRNSDPEDEDLPGYNYGSELEESSTSARTIPVPIPVVEEPYEEGQMELTRRTSDPDEEDISMVVQTSDESDSVEIKRPIPQELPEESQMEQLRRTSQPEEYSSGTPQVAEPESAEVHSDWSRIGESMLLDTAFMAVPLIFAKLKSVFSQTEKVVNPIVADKATSNEPKENEETSMPQVINETGTETELAKNQDEQIEGVLLNNAHMEAQIQNDDTGAGTHEPKMATGTETQQAEKSDTGSENRFSVQSAAAGTQLLLENSENGSYLEEKQVGSGTDRLKSVSESTDLFQLHSDQDKSTFAGSTTTTSTSTMMVIPLQGRSGSNESSADQTKIRRDSKTVQPIDQTQLANDRSNSVIPTRSSGYSGNDQVERPSQASNYDYNKLSTMTDINEGLFPPPATAAESEVDIKMPAAVDSVLMLITSVPSTSGTNNAQSTNRSVETRMPHSSGVNRSLSREMLMMDETSGNAQTSTLEMPRSSLHPEQLHNLVSRLQDFQQKENIFHDMNSGVIANLAIDQAQRTATMGPDTKDFSETVTLESQEQPSTSQTMNNLNRRTTDLTENDDRLIELTSEAIAEEAIGSAANQVRTCPEVGTCSVTKDPSSSKPPLKEKEGPSRTLSRKKKVKKDNSEVGHSHSHKSKKQKKNNK